MKSILFNQKGFAHLGFMVLAIMVVVGIGGVGAYVISSSKAAGSYSTRWADCYMQSYHFQIGSAVLPKNVGEAYTWGKGPAVKYFVIELQSFAKQTFYGNEGKLKHTYSKVSAPKWRTATFSLYCPNAKNPNTGSHWKTEVRGAYQNP